jgi:hypothetical protein
MLKHAITSFKTFKVYKINIFKRYKKVLKES